MKTKNKIVYHKKIQEKLTKMIRVKTVQTQKDIIMNPWNMTIIVSPILKKRGANATAQACQVKKTLK